MKDHNEKKESTSNEDQSTTMYEAVKDEVQADCGNDKNEKTAQSNFEQEEGVLESLQKQNAELKDQYLRKVADFDNYRKRMIREKQEAYEYANTGLLTDLIAILDDFDRALAAGSASDQNSVVDGIKMINKQMRGLLEAKYNLECYTETGDAFDPNIHEAIGSTPATVAEPTVAEIYLKGYKLRDRVIRAAKVMVHMPDGSVASDEVKTEDATASTVV